MLCPVKAPLAQVQVRTAASQPRTGIGNNIIPVHHEAKQLGLGRTFPASDT
jgi:hypothetical protein